MIRSGQALLDSHYC